MTLLLIWQWALQVRPGAFNNLVALVAFPALGASAYMSFCLADSPLLQGLAGQHQKCLLSEEWLGETQWDRGYGVPLGDGKAWSYFTFLFFEDRESLHQKGF